MRELLLLKQKDRLLNWHLLILLGLFASFILAVDSVYRGLAYINLLFMSGVYLYGKRQGNIIEKNILWIIGVPLIFTIMLHWISVTYLVFPKSVRHLLLALFIAYGVYWQLLNTKLDRQLFGVAFYGVIIGYLVIELLFVLLGQTDSMGRAIGTTKNSHYLAQGALISCIALIFFPARNWLLRILWLLSMACAIFLLLKTSSRPAWIALIFGITLLLGYFPVKKRMILVLIFCIGLAILSMTNFANFMSRVQDLWVNVTHEERVYIWQDTIRMLMDNSGWDWLFGHGLNSFYQNFKPYSSYHLQGADFNSPHNFLLELVYIQGVVGLLFVLSCVFWLGRILISQIKVQKDNWQHSLAWFALVLLIINLIFTSIVVPFYSAYTINVIAVSLGIALYLRSNHDDYHV